MTSKALPAAALAKGLREVLRDGAALPWTSVGTLAAWALAAGTATALTFRWE